MAVAGGLALAIWPVAWLAPAIPDDNALRALAASLLAPALSLAAGVGVVARHRFVTESAIAADPAADDAGDRTLALGRAYLTNTVEQAVLAALAYASLSVALAPDWRAAVPLCALCFLVGRATFARGLGRAARHRAFGFAVTFYPSVIGLVVAVIALVIGPC